MHVCMYTCMQLVVDWFIVYVYTSSIKRTHSHPVSPSLSSIPGGNAVINHLAQPASFPLYHQAIIESGAYNSGAWPIQVI